MSLRIAAIGALLLLGGVLASEAPASRCPDRYRFPAAAWRSAPASEALETRHGR